MEALSRSLFLLALFSSIISAASTNFIASSCAATRYPALCVRSLSAYATTIQQSPKQLAQTALAVSLARARSASSFASNMAGANGLNLKKRDRAALKDCLDNIGDSVDDLARSARELSRIGRSRGSGFMWHMSNVQTWVSAALTDEYTCVDGLAENAVNGRLKVALRSRIVDVAQVTSNALALANQYVEYAQSTTAVAKPYPPN